MENWCNDKCAGETEVGLLGHFALHNTTLAVLGLNPDLHGKKTDYLSYETAL
jgi:hypothetical protein